MSFCLTQASGFPAPYCSTQRNIAVRACRMSDAPRTVAIALACLATSPPTFARSTAATPLREVGGIFGVNASDIDSVLCWLMANWAEATGVAIAAAVLFVTALSYYRGGFRTRVIAWVDYPRQRIRVMVHNGGRSSGQIESVSILCNEKVVSCTWLCNIQPQGYILGPHSTEFFLAERFDPFPRDAKVRVRLNGQDRNRRLRRSFNSWEC